MNISENNKIKTAGFTPYLTKTAKRVIELCWQASTSVSNENDDFSSKHSFGKIVNPEQSRRNGLCKITGFTPLSQQGLRS